MIPRGCIKKSILICLLGLFNLAGTIGKSKCLGKSMYIYRYSCISEQKPESIVRLSNMIILACILLSWHDSRGSILHNTTNSIIILQVSCTRDTSRIHSATVNAEGPVYYSYRAINSPTLYNIYNNHKWRV